MRECAWLICERPGNDIGTPVVRAAQLEWRVTQRTLSADACIDRNTHRTNCCHCWSFAAGSLLIENVLS